VILEPITDVIEAQSSGHLTIDEGDEMARGLETRHAGMYLQTALRMEYLFFGWGRCGVFFTKPACSRLASEIPAYLFS